MSRAVFRALVLTLLPPAAGLAAEQAPASVGAQPAEPAPPPAAVDPVAEAYRIYSEARLARTPDEREAAVDLYRRAAELDPGATAPLIALASLSLAAFDLEAAEAAAAEAVKRDPESATAHRVLGTVHFRQLRRGDGPETTERGIAALSEAVRLDPDDLQSRSELARLLALARRGEEAAAHLRDLVRRAPDAFGELALLARLRLEAGDREQAFDHLLQSLRIEPRQPDAREMLDDLLRGPDIPGRSAEGALEEVVALYETASANHPDDEPLRLALADGLARVGRLDDAGEAFERLLTAESDSEVALMGLAMVRRQQKRLDDAEAALVRLLALNERSVPGRLALGGIFAARCEFERAADEFEALVALPVDTYGVSRRREILARLSRMLEEIERHDEAYEALDDAVLLAGDAPDAIRYRVALVQNRLAAGAPEEAAELVAELIEDHSEDPGLLTLKARVLAAGGDAETALAILRGLVDRYPETAGAAHALLRHHVETEDLASAEELARTWLRRRPDDQAFRFQLAAVLERQGRIEEAEAEFREIIAATPDHDLALNYLGYMLADQNERLEESEALIQRALDQDPYNGSYLDSLGWVQFRKGELGLAEPNLLRARRCMPKNSVVLDHLGDLYRAKGNAEEAVRFWRLAIEHDGDRELERDTVVRKIEEAGNDPE